MASLTYIKSSYHSGLLQKMLKLAPIILREQQCQWRQKKQKEKFENKIDFSQRVGTANRASLFPSLFRYREIHSVLSS